MDDRFVTFRFDKPIPRQSRRADWRACGKCASAFFLEGATRPGPPELPVVASSSCRSGPHDAGASQREAFMKELRELCELKSDGFLDDDEFRQAKRRLLEM